MRAAVAAVYHLRTQEHQGGRASVELDAVNPPGCADPDLPCRHGHGRTVRRSFWPSDAGGIDRQRERKRDGLPRGHHSVHGRTGLGAGRREGHWTGGHESVSRASGVGWWRTRAKYSPKKCRSVCAPSCHRPGELQALFVASEEMEGSAAVHGSFPARTCRAGPRGQRLRRQLRLPCCCSPVGGCHRHVSAGSS